MFDWFQGFWNWLKGYFDAFFDRLGRLWDWIGSFFHAFLDKLQDIWNFLLVAAYRTGLILRYIYDWLAAFSIAFFDATWRLLLDFLSFVLDKLGDLAIWALGLVPINPSDFDLQSRLSGLGSIILEILFAVGFHQAIGILAAAILFRLTINLLSGIVPFLRA